MNKPDEDLESLFGAARRDLPPVDADSIATNALAAPLTAPSHWQGLAPKLALATVVIASLGGVAWWQLGATSTPSRTAPVEVVPVVAITPAPVPPPPAMPAPAAPLAPPPEVLPPRRVSRTHVPEVVEPPQPTASELELQEGAVLLRARRALSRHEPEVALLACEEHARTFAQGRLAPEREAIAIDALHALGRVDQARARAERFIARWPDSAYADRARRALAE